MRYFIQTFYCQMPTNKSYRLNSIISRFRPSSVFQVHLSIFLMLGIALITSNWASYIFIKYVSRHVSCVYKGHRWILIDHRYRYNFFQKYFMSSCLATSSHLMTMCLFATTLQSFAFLRNPWRTSSIVVVLSS